MERRILLLFLVIFSIFSFSSVFGENIFISSVLPNTTDDTNDEYIELINYSSDIVSLSGFSIKDKSGKTFFFTNQILNSLESKKFYRPETMILLNNTDEELFLYDNSLTQIDYFSYVTSVKNISIITGHQSQNQTTQSGAQQNTDNNVDVILPRFISTGSILNISSTGAKLEGLVFTGTDSVNISWGTGELVFTGIIYGTGYEFNNLQEEINYFYKLEIISETGVIIDSATGGFISLGIPIVATELYYSDSDNNSKIDLLEIKFNKNIKGTLDYEKIKIYSNSGGLSSKLINSETGIISNFSIYNNILLLSLVEQDNIRGDLTINNTTSSNLRLKSLDGLGITSISGINIPAFSLTSSFDNYKNVYKKSSNSNGGVSEVLTGVINETSDGNSVSNSGLTIPEIVIVFQQPSYVIENETNSGEYFCDKTKSECRINFSLLNSFSGSFSENNYRCEINIGTGNIINTCNPDTITFPYSIYNISFKILDKNDINNFKEKTIKLYNIYETLEIPDPIIKIQSGLNSNNQCTKAICSINPTASDSFLNMQNPKYACSWNFAGGTYNLEDLQKCNPSYIRYPYGDFVIKLRIYEIGNFNNFKETNFSFRNDIIENYGGGNFSNNELKKISSIITLQGTIGGKTKKQSGNKLTCIGVETCSVNFTGEHSYSMSSNKLYFEWIFGNGQNSILKNPSSIVYGTGIYNIKLKVTDSLGNQDISAFIVEVTNSGNLDDNILEAKTMKYKTQKFKEFTTNYEDFLLSNIVKKKTKKQNIKTDESDFDNVFKEILEETNSELNFEKVLDKLLLNTNEEIGIINNYSIKLQGKLSNNLGLKDDLIICKGRKNCKINLSLDGEKLTGYKYVWKYPSGEEFVGINPKTVTFNFGQYLVGLEIYDKKGALVLSQNIRIIVQKILTKPKIVSTKNKTSTKTNIFSFVIKRNNGVIQEFFKDVSNSKIVLVFLISFIMVIGSAQLIKKNSAILVQL